MKKTFLFVTSVLALAGSAQAAAPVPLFDGKTLNGWSMSPADSWIVKEGGIMASTGNGGGQIWTNDQYTFYRVIFSHRHNIAPVNNHYGSALVFCDTPPPISRALHGIQFGLPNGPHWDYRIGHNNGGGSLFTQTSPGYSYTVWSRVEILVDGRNGTARMAVAQPIGNLAVPVLSFKDLTAGRKGPFAFQMHNAGLFDEYKDITIEVDPAVNDLITTKPAPVVTNFQAEEAVLAGGTVVEATHVGFNGSGYANSSATGGSITFNNVNGLGGGAKTLSIRYALAGTASRTGSLVVNGATQTITFAPTGAFTTWATRNVTVWLPNTATNTIRFNTTGQDLANIDEITVSALIVPPAPITIQAETGVVAGTGSQPEATNGGFNGTGYVNLGTTGGSVTLSNVSGNGGGTKALAIRYALGAATARTCNFTVNGVTQAITFQPTGAWTTWETLAVTASLTNSASNTLVITSTGADAGNIDQITVP